VDELTGKVAVVTGAASGIGLALARALVAEGMKVVLADIEEPALEAALAGFPEGAEVRAVRCDVSDPAAVDALRDAAVEAFGTVHVVANNAGVSTGGPVWSHAPEDWDWVLGVNLFGVVNGVRSFTPLLIEQGEGHIVNTASMAGLSSPPFMGVYNVSKHAVVTLSETLFGDLALAGAEGVGVSVLCPGWVQTRIHEAGRNRPESDADATPSLAESAPGFAEVAAALIAGGLDPDDVARQVVDAIRTRRFYILTHPEWKPMISGRVARIVDESDPVIAGLPD
jgi:NAD(P)-dependent dehydrogenase (short-subunit alcohol dehydrogenase family)